MLPEKIDRYKIISESGNGGTAVVYKAYDPQQQQDVAVKVLLNEHRTSPEFRTQFKSEVGAIFAFKHPAVVPILGYGMFTGKLYLVTRFMPGGSLGDFLAGGKVMAPAEVINLLRRITPALDAAHQKGLLHRNLKPGNILYDDQGQACLADFGIPCLMQAQPPAGPYLSPEQARGNARLDARSDLYALGVLVYQMLAGILPFEGGDPQGSQPVPDILSVNPNLPPGCSDFFRKALDADPAGRFTSATGLADALASVAGGAPPAGQPRRPFKTEVISMPSSGRVTLIGEEALPPPPKPPQPAPPRPRQDAPPPRQEPSQRLARPAQAAPRPQAQAPRAAPPQVSSPRPMIRAPVVPRRSEPGTPPVGVPVRPPGREDDRKTGAMQRPVQPRNPPRPQQDPMGRTQAPQKGSSGPSLARYQTSISEFFRRVFGVNPVAPSFRPQVAQYITVPAFLRPITGPLGLPSTIAISPRGGALKIILILAAVLFLLGGCAAACFLVFRLVTAARGFNGWEVPALLSSIASFLAGG